MARQKRRRGFFLLTLVAGRAGLLRATPAGEKKKLNSGVVPPILRCSRQERSMFTTGVSEGSIGRPRRELRMYRPSFFRLFFLASSRRGVDGTKSPGNKTTVGSNAGFQRVAFPLSPATPCAATTAQRWESRGGTRAPRSRNHVQTGRRRGGQSMLAQLMRNPASTLPPTCERKKSLAHRRSSRETLHRLRVSKSVHTIERNSKVCRLWRHL